MNFNAPHEITIEPVDMSGHYTVMLIVCGVLLIGGIGVAVGSYFITENYNSERVGMILGATCAGVGLIGFFFWGGFGLATATENSIDDHIEQQLEQTVGLHNIITTDGAYVSSGFIAVTSDGQTVRGIVKETGHDTYNVVLYEYK